MDQNEKMNFLAESIKQARKVMEKVESGDLSPTNNRRGMSESDVDRFLDNDTPIRTTNESHLKRAIPNMQNISKSKMPAEILKSFQENPIIDPTAPIGMESVMNEITKKVAPIKEPQRIVTEEKNNTQGQIDIKLVEYIIKKTVEETLEQVSKKTQIDETIQIKIGDKVFGGKLTILKENKINEKK
jgi:hypothetical protein